MKTSELTGATLDWAVAQCESLEHYFDDGLVCLKGQPFDTHWRYWNPSTDWAQGGPIIERENICLWTEGYDWEAKQYGVWEEWASTPLIAAMRCYVGSKLGNDVDVPEELK